MASLVKNSVASTNTIFPVSASATNPQIVDCANDCSTAITESMVADAPITNNDYGILVGGKVTTPNATKPSLSKSSYKLNAKLTNAQIAHEAMVQVDMAQTDNKTILAYQRDFENTTSSNVYVDEAGLFMETTAAPTRFLLARTLLNLGASADYITIAPDQILRVKFNLIFPLGTIALT